MRKSAESFVVTIFLPIFSPLNPFRLSYFGILSRRRYRAISAYPYPSKTSLTKGFSVSIEFILVRSSIGTDNAYYKRVVFLVGVTQLRKKIRYNSGYESSQMYRPISNKGTIVHLKGYGLIKVFKIVSKNGNVEYWVTSDLSMNDMFRLKYAELSWAIEEYHRGIK